MKRVFPFILRLLAKALEVGPEEMQLQHIEEQAAAVELKDLTNLMTRRTESAYSLISRDRNIASSVIGLQPGQRALLTNGKVC